jgi:diguanylate cyclase (GGDEF)-like protein
LKELTQILTQDLRKMDIVARYGGDEFVISLPHTSKEQAMALAERIRRGVEEYEFCGEAALPTGDITISLGVAACPEDAVEPEALVKAADMALLEAKKQGNRVCICREMG